MSVDLHTNRPVKTEISIASATPRGDLNIAKLKVKY